MDPLPECLLPLEYLTQPFPREAVREAVARRDEIIPHLLHSLEWALENAEQANEPERPYMLHLFALHLVGQFRERRAFDPIVRMFRSPKYEQLTGDVVTETLPEILASVAGTRTDDLKALVEDQSCDEWVRCAALKALAILARHGEYDTGDLSRYLGELLTTRLEREPVHLWDSIGTICVDFSFPEHLPAIERAYQEGLADPWFDRFEDIKLNLLLAPGSPRRRRPDSYELIDDTVSLMSSWSCFRKPERVHSLTTSERPVTNSKPKVGRNELCPCGSGKKFKKCCG